MVTNPKESLALMEESVEAMVVAVVVAMMMATVVTMEMVAMETVEIITGTVMVEETVAIRHLARAIETVDILTHNPVHLFMLPEIRVTPYWTIPLRPAGLSRMLLAALNHGMGRQTRATCLFAIAIKHSLPPTPMITNDYSGTSLPSWTQWIMSGSLLVNLNVGQT